MDVVDVHHRHLAHGAVEGPAVPPAVEVGDVGLTVPDPQRIDLLLDACPSNELGGQIDSGDGRTQSGHRPGGPALSAGDVEDLGAADSRW